MGECIDAVALMLGMSADTSSAIATEVKVEKERCPRCSLYFADKDEAESHWMMVHCEVKEDAAESEESVPPVLSREEPTTSHEPPPTTDDDEQPDSDSPSPISSALLRPTKFNCGDCPQEFPTLGFLYQHLRLAHGRMTPQIFECVACGDAFTKLGYRERHMRRCCPSALRNVDEVVLGALSTGRRPIGRPLGSSTKNLANRTVKKAVSSLTPSSSISRAAALHGGKVVRLRAVIPSTPRPIAIKPPTASIIWSGSSRFSRYQTMPVSSSSTGLTSTGAFLSTSAGAKVKYNTSTIAIAEPAFYKRPVSASLARLKPAPVESFFWCKTCADPFRKCSLHRHLV